MSPLGALVFWAGWHHRLFELYFLVPGTLFGLFYHVYLVRRFGGTPGKLIVGIRILRLDGEPIGCGEALLRYLPRAVFGLLMSIALLFSIFQMSDAEYRSLDLMELVKRTIALAPPWYSPLRWFRAVWFWGELILLLTNRKKRALHDFIAGTIVVYAPAKATPPVNEDPVVAV